MTSALPSDSTDGQLHSTPISKSRLFHTPTLKKCRLREDRRVSNEAARSRRQGEKIPSPHLQLSAMQGTRSRDQIVSPNNDGRTARPISRRKEAVENEAAAVERTDGIGNNRTMGGNVIIILRGPIVLKLGVKALPQRASLTSWDVMICIR